MGCEVWGVGCEENSRSYFPDFCWKEGLPYVWAFREVRTLPEVKTTKKPYRLHPTPYTLHPFHLPLIIIILLFIPIIILSLGLRLLSVKV
ncbi:MAG: hypothetical protein F6J93_33475 [Oscillatoria sp. SIO1A7]|nr:hypothetical protein [Oscillatoria sp. SIO1A7]